MGEASTAIAAAEHFLGFKDATLDGQPERLALEVVLDRETFWWEIKPKGN